MVLRAFWVSPGLLLGALVTLTHCMTIENLPPEQDLPDGGKIWVSSFGLNMDGVPPPRYIVSMGSPAR